MKKLLFVLLFGFTFGCQSAPVETAVEVEASPTVEEEVEVVEEEPLEFWEGWEYGPVVLNSDEGFDYFPVDPEAFVLPDGRVRLWVDEGGGGSLLRTFTSDDGINFVPEDVPLIPGNFPSVVVTPDGKYRMYVARFDREKNNTPIGSFISDDALNWTEEEGARSYGRESAAVVLEDGRVLLAIRRDSTRDQSTWDPLWPDPPTDIWFAISEDGLNFEDVREVVNGVDASVDEPELSGRTYGVEVTRLSTGEVVMHIDGGIPGYFIEINETTLETSGLIESPLRGDPVFEAYEFIGPDGQPDEFQKGGAGGDQTFIVLNGKDVSYADLLDRYSEPTPGEPDRPQSVNHRQRVVMMIRENY
ncbi:MAG: sialidase family protein [Candidatus Nanopelagicales bacterium]